MPSQRSAPVLHAGNARDSTLAGFVWRIALLIALILSLPSDSIAALPGKAPVLHSLDQAVLETPAGQRTVQLPYVLAPEDFLPEGSSVWYRLQWQLPNIPDRQQAIYVPKMALSGRLYVNGEMVGSCGNASLEELRCLHQPQFFVIPGGLLHQGVNEIAFEIHATARQMNGLSKVQAGDAEYLYSSAFFWREFLTVDVQVGLTWLSTLLGLLSLMVGLVLRRESVFLWFGFTSLINALASLNGIVTHPVIAIDVYNWIIFSSRLISVPLSFMTLLAIFGKDHKRLGQATLLYCLLAPALIWLSDNNRLVAFVLYVPFIFSCPYLIYHAVKWSIKSRLPIHVISTLMMFVLFSGGVLDWLRLGGRAGFDGIYLSAYTYSGNLVTIGVLLTSRLAAALLQSQKMSALLERQVAERIAYEVTENIPVGTFTVSSNPDRGSPLFSFMSQRFLQLTGLDHSLVGASVESAIHIVHPDDRADVARKFNLSIRLQQAFSARMRIVVNEHTRWINIESAPRKRSDGITVWEGVLIDETEQVQAREAAERDRAALQEHLMAQLRMEERERLLRDVHDGFGSQLASVRMMVEKGRIPAEQLSDYLHEVSEDLHLVVDTLGKDGVTLEEALYEMRYRTDQRFAQSGIDFHWEIELNPMPVLSSRTILQILRIMQEAMHNAIRHAQARNIVLTAIYLLDQSRLRVSIRDDGVGMPAAPRHGRGLGNMRHRAREIGAEFSVSSSSAGTEVVLLI